MVVAGWSHAVWPSAVGRGSRARPAGSGQIRCASPTQGDAPRAGAEVDFRCTRARPAAARVPQLPGGSVNGDTPVLDTLADITAASIENNSLAPREFMLARLAALIAVDAPPASYLANAEVAADAGVTAGDIQGVMIAVAPVVGTPRVVAAGGNILRAL